MTTIWEDFMLGGIVAALSKTVSAPLERIKLILQSQSESKTIQKPYKGSVVLRRSAPTMKGFMIVF